MASNGRSTAIDKEVDAIAKDIFGIGFVGNKKTIEQTVTLEQLKKAMMLSYQAGLTNSLQKTLKAYKDSIE